MKTGTVIVEKVTSALVRLLLRPKPYFLEKEKQADRLREPSILVINHTSHLDGPIVNTVFRKDRIHNLAANDRFEQKGFGFFLRHTRCIPIDRNNPDLLWVHESMRVLHEEKEKQNLGEACQTDGCSTVQAAITDRRNEF